MRAPGWGLACTGVASMRKRIWAIAKENRAAFGLSAGVAVDPYSELFVRSDGMIQSGPDPVSETAVVIPIAPRRVA
jgi:hypothetical protein